MSRRTSLLKVLRIFLIVAVGVVAGSWLWLKSVESRQRRSMEKRLAELTAELDAGSGPRPVLKGTPVSGDAWDDYLRAAEMARAIGEISGITTYAFRYPDGDPAPARRALAAIDGVVDAMRQGTRRTELRRVRFHETEPLFQFSSNGPLGRMSKVSALAVARARLFEEDGRADDAAELLLDVGRFGRDVGREASMTAQMMAIAIITQAMDELKELLMRGDPSPEGCLRMEAELKSLEEAVPRSTHCVVAELEWFGKLILQDRLMDDLIRSWAIPPEVRSGWRYAFSQRLQLMAAFGEADRAVPRLRDTETLSYEEETAQWEAFHDELRSSKNLYGQIFSSMVGNAGRRRREKLTQLRLLRMGAHYAATGEILKLEDPFVGQLRHKLEFDRMRFWGIGGDLKDDDGKGKWTPEHHRDIVLEIPRRL